MLKEKLHIDELGQEVVQEIKKRMPQAKVSVKEVVKTNDIILHGIIINDIASESNVTPTIYLDNYYEGYLNDNIAVEEIAEKIIEISNKHQCPVSFDIDMATDYDNVRNMLRIKIVNTERNVRLLQDVPHKDFLDLSAVYQILVSEDESGAATITVNNHLMQMYGVTVDELHEAALENMSIKEPVKIQSMAETMVEILGVEDIPLDELPGGGPEMYVVTNPSKICGASEMLMKETLQKAADIFNGNFYILPSSIHELIAVPATEDVDVQFLRDTVCEINATQVSPDEVLSDNVYFYNVKTGELKIA